MITETSQLRIRWGVVVIVVLLGILAGSIAPINVMALGLLAGLSAAGATAAALIANRYAGSSPIVNESPLARNLGVLFYARTGLDLLIMLVSIYLTGTASSPILLILLGFLFVLDIQASHRVGLVASFLALGAIGGLAWLEFPGWIPYLQILSPASLRLFTEPVYVSSLLVGFSIALYLGVFNARHITVEIRAQQSTLARSQDQLSRRVQELTTQREIGQQLAGSLDLEIVLDRIGASALQLVRADDVHIFLYDESSGKFGKGVGVHSDGDRKIDVIAPRRDGLCNAILRAQRAILIDDVEQHPLFSTRDVKRKKPASVAGMPIKKGDRFLGVLTVACATTHHFNDDEKDALLALADQAALAIDNASLYSQVEQHARELAALYRVNLGISQSLEPLQLIQDALAVVQEIMHVPVCLLMLVDPSSGHLRLAAHRGLKPGAYEEMHLQTLKPGQGFGGRVLATGEPMIVRDASTHPANVLASIRREGIHGLGAVPLKAQDRVLGVLEVMRGDEIEFSAGDIGLLSAIAQQTAIALDRARLYDQAKHRADEMASLREIGLATASTLQLREQLRILHRLVQNMLHPDSFFVGLYDQVRQQVNLEFVVEQGWELRGPVLSLDSAGLSAWVIRERQALRVDDMDKERANLPVPPRHETRPARSWLGVPLLLRERVIGLLSVQSFHPHAYSAADEQFLVSVAQHAALAIENARLYESAEQRAREMELVNEISRAISASLDRNEIFGRTVRALADMFGYEFVSIHLIQNDELHLQAQVGYDATPLVLSLQQGVLGRVVRTGQIAFVRDVRTDGDFYPGVPGVSSEIGVPIRSDQRVIGVLDVEERRPDYLDDKDVRILTSLCEQIGTALRNAELFAGVVERERCTASLRRVALAVNSTLDLKGVLDILCRESLELFGGQNAFAWLIQGQELVGYAAQGEARVHLADGRVSLNDPLALCAETVRQQCALYWNNIQTSPSRESVLLKAIRAESAISVPLMIDNHPLGVLVCTDHRNAQRFGPADLERAKMLMSQASLALANARLYAEAVDRPNLECTAQVTT